MTQVTVDFSLESMELRKQWSIFKVLFEEGKDCQREFFTERLSPSEIKEN